MMTGIYILMAVIITSAIWILLCSIYLRHITLGTLKFDISGETLLVRLDLEDNLDEAIGRNLVVLNVKEADLGVPGTRKAQH